MATARRIAHRGREAGVVVGRREVGSSYRFVRGWGSGGEGVCIVTILVECHLRYGFSRGGSEIVREKGEVF